MITNSTLWIILVVALGLPSTIVGLLVRRMEKKMDGAEKQRDERDREKREHDEFLLNIIMDNMNLAIVTAEAVQRIPDANCNGEMEQALNTAKTTVTSYRKAERKHMAEFMRG